ncbi:undecaprenyl-diphosphate phosphatase [Thermococcus sp. JdF3]|uniref:undecaprenyl-diphosphate phosphatase n=1 Tax=Thermococcus sp. JdF3 TaxID=1638258 RepID=UPI00143BE8E9|nr:undecaprenyl-diphosphate phosphatase [Thermococcus sp. JdF3]NJE01825.1 undecaprenyl-diphosphate phosphatase [Thermococcus sp. JdF3]
MISPVDYVAPLISGIIIALGSWLPVGPEGHSLTTILEAVAPSYGDYLVPAYLGVTFAILFYFRELIALGSHNAIKRRLDPDMMYFIYASVFTLLVGYPVLKTVSDAVDPGTSDLINAIAGLGMILIGLLAGTRGRAPLEGIESSIREKKDEATLVDAVISGLAQGIALIGGLSRSGFVLLGLVSTGMDVKRALELSFLVAPVYLVLKLAFMGGWDPELPVALLFTAFLSAFVVSFVTMKLLLRLAGAVGRRAFLVSFGLIAIAVYLMGVVM